MQDFRIRLLKNFPFFPPWITREKWAISAGRPNISLGLHISFISRLLFSGFFLRTFDPIAFLVPCWHSGKCFALTFFSFELQFFTVSERHLLISGTLTVSLESWKQKLNVLKVAHKNKKAKKSGVEHNTQQQWLQIKSLVAGWQLQESANEVQNNLELILSHKNKILLL